MKVLISGASGLIGSALGKSLRERNHEVAPLVRRQAKAGEVSWDPATGVLDRAAIEGFDAIIHLAGDNVASGRWTAAKKAAIRDSRVKSTQLLSSAIQGLSRPPKTFVCASAIGIYGDRGTEAVDESSAPGKGFLADVCKDWEAAALPTEHKGVRTVLARFGVVLSAAGGPLAKMLLPFKMGAGGKVGPGTQYFSWVALDDVVGALQHMLEHTGLRGAVNVVAPNPVTNLEFTKALGKALGRPTVIPMPAFLARIAFGEMADELLLSSTRVVPARLRDGGFPFAHPTIAPALAYIIGKGR